MNEVQESLELNFEQSVTALEKIVEQMARQDMSLDDLIEAYEKGIGYLHLCQKNLEEAEMKINMLNARIKKIEEGDDDNG